MVWGIPPSASRAPSGGRLRLLWRLAGAMLLLCIASGQALAHDHRRRGHDHAGERGPYGIKADYLAKFTPFVTWPESAFEGPTSPFRLCIGGYDPFGKLIDRVTLGRRVGEHPIVVVRLQAVTKAAECHMLFVSASRAQPPSQMFAAVAGHPVLTVADETLEAPEAMIQFVTVEGRVRFDIRSDAAQAQGLTLSSKLQSLSVSPRGGPR